MLKAINELVVTAAVDLELEDGRQLRVDTTVVQSDIHHPTDNTLLWVIPISELPTLDKTAAR
jgi:transposase, IS5 family